MKRRLAVTFLTAVMCVLWIGQAHTAPQPSEVLVDWELGFRYKDLQAVRVNIPGEPGPRLFWYLRYQVSNHTGEDQIFIPGFALYSETGQLIRAGQRVPLFVFDHIKKLLNDPFIKDTAAMTDKLLQGDDNAKDGVAIWQDFDPAAGTIDIFVGGLSGETAEIQLPKPVRVAEMDLTGEMKEVVKRKIVLSKTLQMTYSIPGQAEGRLHTPIKLVEQKWVMR